MRVLGACTSGYQWLARGLAATYLVTYTAEPLKIKSFYLPRSSSFSTHWTFLATR